MELTTERNQVYRGCVHVQQVDLFEGQTLGLRYGVNFFAITRNGEKRKTDLRDAEVGENEASGTGRSPYEERFDLQTRRAGFFVDQVWGSLTDSKVPDPIGGDGERHSLSSRVEGEDVSGDDPCDRTPRREEGGVDADEYNQRLLSGGVLGRDRDTNVMAFKNSQTYIPMGPIKSNLLRPNLPTPHIPGRVTKTPTMLRAMVTKKELEVPAFMKNVVP